MTAATWHQKANMAALWLQEIEYEYTSKARLRAIARNAAANLLIQYDILAQQAEDDEANGLILPPES